MFLGLFIALVVALLLVVYRVSLLEASTKRQASQLMQQESEPTAKLLPESDLEPVPTVTERTTELLGLKRRAALKSVRGSPKSDTGFAGISRNVDRIRRDDLWLR